MTIKETLQKEYDEMHDKYVIAMDIIRRFVNMIEMHESDGIKIDTDSTCYYQAKKLLKSLKGGKG